MLRVVHFEIPASDLDRAVKFYKGVFWWDISKWQWEEEYFSVMTWKDGEWIDWWIEKGKTWAYTCVIEVPDIDKYIKKITEAWWSVIDGKRDIWWMWYVAYLKDPEWNMFWLFEMIKKM